MAIVKLITMLPVPVLAAMGHGLGMTAYYLGASRRKIALKNIRTCFPEWTDEECERVNKEHFGYVGKSVFMVPFNMWASERRLKKILHVTDRHHYDKALNEGRNIIILAPHFVGLDAGGLAVSIERDAITMYQYAKNTLMDEIIKRGRSRFGGLLIERKDPLRKTIKAIRTGMPFYYLPDQDAGRKGVFVPFFGTQASTVPMLGKFAKMSDAVVIPIRANMLRMGKGYEVSFGEPLKDFPTGDDIADTTTMNRAVEDLIRTMPEQYFWVHKRFKTRPPEEQGKFY